MNDLFETLRKLGPTRLSVMGAVLMGLLMFFIYISMQVSSPHMKLLYKDLSSEDSSAVAAKLEELKITYDVSPDGSIVQVSDKDVGKARMLLAQEGLPNGGSMGYELFDKQSSFGTTSFVQNITQVRAMEGELARTIASLESIKSARVHLVLPQRELFSRETHAASASVFLRLKGSGQLDAEQIMGIQSMVANAVPNLKPKNVSIIDSHGNLLATGTEDDASLLSNKAEDARRKYEQHMTKVIEDLIGRTVGFGKVHANVVADLNFDQLSENQEIYDPQGQVARSTQNVDDKNSETSTSGDGVSVQNNLPAGNQGGALDNAAEPTSNAARTEETVNYEISKTIRSIVRQTGEVKKLSASVLIDGTYTTDKDNKKTYVPRTEVEIKNITALVSSAIGYDEKRGDKLEIVNMQFADIATEAEDDGTKIMGFERSDLLNAAEILIVAIMIILVVLLVLQPMVGRLLSQEGEAIPDDSSNLDSMGLLQNGTRNPALMSPSMAGGAGGGGGMNLEASQFMEDGSDNSDLIDVQKVEGRVKASSLKKVEDIVLAYPDETVSVIRGWMATET
ncbi:MAG: flagellar basal-body MS-ring/collar protein FliF [Pseudomonadota bacterium]